MIQFQSAYKAKDADKVLWELMQEREEHVNISHRQMPTWDSHCDFVASRPYPYWFLFGEDGVRYGAIYMTKAREIGVFVFRAHRGKGYGRFAVSWLMQRYPGRFFANINPSNAESIRFFEGLGFIHVQNTYSR